MKILIDACVLYPTVLRRLVLGVAEAGAFTPLWSARILEEWARAAARSGAGGAVRAEIASLQLAFPEAEIAANPELEARLDLPDLNDVHVLAAAITGAADELLTLNITDFPTRVLARHHILRRQPDEFLLENFHADGPVAEVAQRVYAQALEDGITMPLRALLKKSRLPRLGKALG
ncbi:MAG: PIN domain-containing protein [Pseudomonadota bacterium]